MKEFKEQTFARNKEELFIEKLDLLKEKAIFFMKEGHSDEESFLMAFRQVFPDINQITFKERKEI